MKLLSVIWIAALTAAISASRAQCAEMPASKVPPASAQKVKQRPFSGTIKTVDKAIKAIILKGEKAQTFLVTAQTKIKKNGKPATLDQIVPGDSLGGFARQMPDGKWEALTLNVGLKTAPGAAAPVPAAPAKGSSAK